MSVSERVIYIRKGKKERKKKKGGRKMKCEKCQKEGAYIRLRTGEIVCRQCGHITEKEEKKEKEKEVEK